MAGTERISRDHALILAAVANDADDAREALEKANEILDELIDLHVAGKEHGYFDSLMREAQRPDFEPRRDDPSRVSRDIALAVARAQRAIFEMSENLHASADDLGVVIVACEDAPTDRSDEAQAAFWEPFYADAQAEEVTA